MHILIFVLLAGFAINSHNTGGVASLDEAKADIVHAIKNPAQADWSKLND